MVPDGVVGQALGLFFAKHLVMPAEFFQDFVKVRFFYVFSASLRVYCCPANIILVRWLRPGNVACPGNKLGLLCIQGL